MATATMSAETSSKSPGSPVEVDPRVAAFCSKQLPELFHACAYANDIWKRDPFDVESIHPGARETFQRIVGRVREASGLPTGRILLLLGESGAGKTHLMRAFRNQVHARSSGYCGYLQMTAFTGQYGRYVLNNLIDSLDKPYDESRSETTGLMRLSNALAESSRDVPRDWLDRLRDGGLDQPSLDQLVAEMADRIILDDRFNTIDVYLIQVLLYLQCNDPRIKARVLKYLRCEDLTEHDRRLLGGIVPCTYPDAPHRLIERLGQSMWAVENVPLVLCVNQLEDIFDLDDAAVKFRRAMATLCDLVSRLRSAIVVIACLEDYYAKLKELLTRPIKDRVENDPPPLGLATPCDRNQVEQLIAQRLKYLYESMDIPVQLDQPLFPLPDAMIGRLVGLHRDVLNEVYLYREHCIAKGKMADSPFDGPLPPPAPDIEGKITEIEQAWNEFHSTWTTVVPSDESELAGTLSEAIASCSAELETGDSFEAERDGRFVPVERHAADNSVGRMLVGICNKGPQGGAGPSDRRGRPAHRRAHSGDRALDGVPGESQVSGLAAARKTDRPGRPARGRRGLRLAHHDGAGRVPLGPRHRRRPRLRGLAQAEPALDRPHVVARSSTWIDAPSQARRTFRKRPDRRHPRLRRPSRPVRLRHHTPRRKQRSKHRNPYHDRPGPIASSSVRPATAAASRWRSNRPT